MKKRKAGINVKISDVFRKRALYGVAIFCITAIATVGALSIGGNGDDNTPDSLVDLNETKEPEGTQVADGTEQPDAQGQEIQFGDVNDPEDVTNPEGTQVAENPEDITGSDVPDETQVADVPEDSQGSDAQNPTQVADAQNPSQATGQPEDTEESAEVLSPQLIAEQLNFDKTAGLLMPVEGEVIIPYSPDHGVFHLTLAQFGTSEAVVLSSEVGTEVKAAAKGVVTSIEEDVRTGTTVTLALGNDTSLVYGQMEVDGLKEGDVVEAGECLGTVAEPTRYYVVEGPNLYFKVLEGESAIDPTELLKAE